MSSFVNNYYNVEDLHISEKEKSQFDYLKKSVDYYIAYLVHEKTRIKTARNLYDGKRDRDEFRYLEETFGIETPIAVRMTPIIKTRIDVLLGLLLDEVFTYKVSINDENTITEIEDAKKNERAKRILGKYRAQLEENQQKIEQGQEPTMNAVTERWLKRMEKSINEDFISEFEIAAQSLIKFFEKDSSINLKQRVKQYFLDLLIAGEAYYRTYIERVGEDPKIEICKPENVFFSTRTDHQFLSEGNIPNVNAVVHRTYMKRSEILHKWGHLMNQEVKDRLFGEVDSDGGRRIDDPRTLDHIYRQEDYYDSGTIHNQHTNTNMDTLPVYHVEWLANNEVKVDGDEEFKHDSQTVEKITSSEVYNDTYGKKAANGVPGKKAYRLDRYEGIRIGQDIYLNMGKSKYIPRSIGKPWATTLSYNGVMYNARNGQPYSVTLSLKDIQDSYDIIKFFRDNLIANAGVDGSRINLAGIPKILGQDYMERLMKFLALRKQGIEVYDPTEEGAHLFQHYGDFRGSLNPGAVEALAVVLESLEREADIVTGINRHMYQAAEVRDAVSNVKVGQQTTSLITKDIFELVHQSRKFLLEDLINQAKICYKKGKRGSYIVGSRQILFNIQPDNFCWTDYNIHVINSSKENIKIERLNGIIPELIGAGALDPDIAIKVTISDSPTEILQIVNENLAVKAEENDQVQQLMGQLEQMQGQIKEQEKALQQAQKQIQATEKAADDLKRFEVETKAKTEEEKIRLADERLALDKKIAEEEIYKDKMVVQLEREQLHVETGAGNAKEVRNDI